MRTFLCAVLLLSSCLLGPAQAHEDQTAARRFDMTEGGIVHLEIPTTDTGLSSIFYGELFGWESMPVMEGYNSFSTPNGFGGAFSSFAEVADDGGVVLYIYCADIDSKLPEIEAAGGTIVEGRTPIPGVGHYALFLDCCGNVIGLFSAEDAPVEPGTEG